MRFFCLSVEDTATDSPRVSSWGMQFPEVDAKSFNLSEFFYFAIFKFDNHQHKRFKIILEEVIKRG
jgi:hypothetical protein